MAAIDYNAVFDAVSLKLRELYPTSAIYDSPVEQNLDNGDIVILPITPDDKEEMSKRHRQSLTVDITVFFNADESVAVCLTAAHKLLSELKLVETTGGDRLHGKVIDSNVEDNIVHIVMKYCYAAFYDTDREVMTQIESEVNYG